MDFTEYPISSYIYTDHLGSLRLITEDGGKIIWEADYYAFGQQFATSLRDDRFNYGFTGKEFDPESGLNYHGARFMDSKIGRFLQVDPKKRDYTSLSYYQYCRNNPVKLIDPNGEYDLDPEQNYALFMIDFNRVKGLGHGYLYYNDSQDKSTWYRFETTGTDENLGLHGKAKIKHYNIENSSFEDGRNEKEFLMNQIDKNMPTEKMEGFLLITTPEQNQIIQNTANMYFALNSLCVYNFVYQNCMTYVYKVLYFAAIDLAVKRFTQNSDYCTCQNDSFHPWCEYLFLQAQCEVNFNYIELKKYVLKKAKQQFLEMKEKSETDKKE